MEHLTDDERELLAKARAAIDAPNARNGYRADVVGHWKMCDFIAAATPETVVKLLEEIERLRKQIEDMSDRGWERYEK